MKHNYFVISIVLAVIFWFLDSSIHWLLSDHAFELIPDEANELWMRVLIVTLLVSFGFYASDQTKRLLAKEEEKRRIFKATVYSTQHILNNLLNQLILFKMEMDESDDFSEETKDLFTEILNTSAFQVQKLSAVENITEDEIKASVYPK